jgi:hypothetical protein
MPIAVRRIRTEWLGSTPAARLRPDDLEAIFYENLHGIAVERLSAR